ncbi:hypothetical protein CsSME_00020205 [Camellia sinensis var. sinensis]
MQWFLKDGEARQDEHKTFYNLVVEIREVAYDVEDVIGSELSAIKSKITWLIENLQIYKFMVQFSALQRRSQLRQTYSHIVDEDFVGFEQDITILIAQMKPKTVELKLYYHQDVRRHFDAFAWVSISQQWQLKDKSQQIVNIIDDDQLVKQLCEVQQEKKCSIVLDDIWSIDAWHIFAPAFPSVNASSKIILTTRNKNVASGYLYEL